MLFFELCSLPTTCIKKDALSILHYEAKHNIAPVPAQVKLDDLLETTLRCTVRYDCRLRYHCCRSWFYDRPIGTVVARIFRVRSAHAFRARVYAGHVIDTCPYMALYGTDSLTHSRTSSLGTLRAIDAIVVSNRAEKHQLVFYIHKKLSSHLCHSNGNAHKC